MEKIIAGRHLEVDEATKAYVLDELTALEAEYHKLTSARVILDMQRTKFEAEIVLRGKNLDIEGRGHANDLRAAIDLALAKTDAQLRKHLDRIQDHHHKSIAEAELDKTSLVLEGELEA